jgi:methylenetetrahydrofolate dehydrogenase (NADP+)/methenyltetrahydrofolate cyclohydrolase
MKSQEKKMVEIIDGKKISQEIREEIKQEVEQLKKQGIQPHLSVVLVGEDPASQIYVRSKGKACEKAGISSETLIFPDNLKQEELLDVVRKLNVNPDVHGILVQLPLPHQIDENLVIQTIDPSKDVDGFHPINMGKLASGIDNGFVPCTPNGILELLLRSDNPPDGKHVVIVGRSNIVGKPLGLLLLRKRKGGNATVSFCHSRTPDLSSITRTADILIAAVGSPEIIKKDMVKPDVVVIDVGMNRIKDESHPKGSRLVGDVDFSNVSTIAKAITPVPGGVGPMTITLLLKNTYLAAQKK